MARRARRADRWKRAVVLACGTLACSGDPTGPSADDFPDEPAPDPQPEVVAFVDVNVVPMDVERVLTGQTVIVRGSIIERVGAVGSVSVPGGAFVIDGRGRYLLPGLADMHVHLTSRFFSYLRNDFILWMASGVTTLRVMWGSSGILDEQTRIREGTILGPDLLVASPGLDAPGGTWTGSTPGVATPEEARQRVVEHATKGYDFIKVYNDLDFDTYEAIADEAAVRGIPVVGHVPWRVGIERVQDAGQLTLEHFIGIKNRAASSFDGGDVDEGAVRSLAARSAAAGAWHTPTITVDALSRSSVEEIRSSEELRAVSPGMRSFFEDGFYHGLSDDVAARERTNHELMTRIVREEDGRLLVGTDAGFGWIVPGSSIHDELDAFVASGVTAFEALRAATSAAASSVGHYGSFGRVTEGLRADLVLVVDNPLTDIGTLREPSGTMVRGRWLSRGTLARRIDEIRESYLVPITQTLGEIPGGVLAPRH